MNNFVDDDYSDSARDTAAERTAQIHTRDRDMSLPSYSAVTSESVFLDEEFADEQTEGDPEFLLELVGDLVEDAESQMDVLEQVLTPEELDYQQALKEKTLDVLALLTYCCFIPFNSVSSLSHRWLNNHSVHS
eukprot:TRINITY_DN66418_c7_g1_i3.p1 TRINITY_DN66418_c7_g1~~TRINITY_DN66418_c7_g1_i3.p1  ORF type:complete len:133 (+),score=32.07 TRINITY_DN66418_c7_g1_i3:136-534(+)